jgi:hypothetical protein
MHYLHILRRLSWGARLFLAGFILLSIFAARSIVYAEDGDDDNYDRLDGHGRSGKRVDVIEWEGNLEIHVYPAGSLVGLALKLDDKNTAKKVMVIGYRFDNNPQQQLIRRAILGIDLQKSFKVYKDPGESEFDKILISNNALSTDLVAYRLDPAPTQLYPDGDPRNQQNQDSARTELAQSKPKESMRAPAAAPVPVPAPAPASTSEKKTAPAVNTDDGTVRPFFMDK